MDVLFESLTGSLEVKMLICEIINQYMWGFYIYICIYIHIYIYIIFPFQIISQNLQWKEHGMGSKKDFKIKWKNSSVSCHILGEWFGRQVTATDNYKS